MRKLASRFLARCLKKCGLVTLSQMEEAIASVRAAHSLEVAELQQQITMLKRPCSQRTMTLGTIPVCEACPKHTALVERTEGAVTKMDEVVTRLEAMMQESWPKDFVDIETSRRLVEATAE